jgi:spore coat polysaccharide biosynthesis protein SpsF
VVRIHSIDRLKVGAIIQARMGSTRFPGKIHKVLIKGFTVLSYLLMRLSKCRMLDVVIVATTDNHGDDGLAAWLKEKNIPFFRGAEEDCLERIYLTCKKFKVDIVVRITSDCPLVVPEIVDKMLEYYFTNREHLDYLSNREYTNYPNGVDVEIFTFTHLEEAALNSKKLREREHINYYFLDRPEKFKIRYYNHCLGHDYSRFHLSIDTTSDLEYVNRLFSSGLPENFSFKELADVLDQFNG